VIFEWTSRFRTRGDIPSADHSFAPAREQLSPVWREDDTARKSVISMHGSGGLAISRLDIPNLDGVIRDRRYAVRASGVSISRASKKISRSVMIQMVS
jgi:hypothetical protein